MPCEQTELELNTDGRKNVARSMRLFILRLVSKAVDRRIKYLE